MTSSGAVSSDGVTVERRYFVYIMSNASRLLYVAVTNDVPERAFQHKSKLISGFTQKHNLRKSVYFAAFANVRTAIAC